MLPLSSSQRRYLRAQAHHLSPVVMIGDAGLSPAVLKETASALKAHELIKIKVMNDERTEREAMLKSICDTLKAAPVQHVGKMLVVYKAAATPVIKLPR